MSGTHLTPREFKASGLPESVRCGICTRPYVDPVMHRVSALAQCRGCDREVCDTCAEFDENSAACIICEAKADGASEVVDTLVNTGEISTERARELLGDRR